MTKITRKVQTRYGAAIGRMVNGRPSMVRSDMPVNYEKMNAVPAEFGPIKRHWIDFSESVDSFGYEAPDAPTPQNFKRLRELVLAERMAGEKLRFAPLRCPDAEMLYSKYLDLFYDRAGRLSHSTSQNFRPMRKALQAGTLVDAALDYESYLKQWAATRAKAFGG